MKSTGIVRKVDPLGRIVIPQELCRTLDITSGTSLEILVRDEEVILTKYQEKCILCSQPGQMKVFKGKNVCQNCINSVKEKI